MSEVAAATSAALPKIPKGLLGQFVSEPMTGEAAIAASTAFKKAADRAPNSATTSATRAERSSLRP